MNDIQNAITPEFISKLDRWADAFERVLVRWDEWLMEVHSLHLQGAFLQLAGRQSEGESVISDFHALHRQRAGLLSDAEELGVYATGLTQLAEKLIDGKERSRIARFKGFGVRLRTLQQHSVTLWIMAFQSQTHVSQMLQILSTGDVANATYGERESESLGGGRLVDQAA